MNYTWYETMYNDREKWERELNEAESEDAQEIKQRRVLTLWKIVVQLVLALLHSSTN